ncbi:MAG: 1-deoxy-D-xylulose-5-phosphate reductoisomerase [Xanthomonadales bacterium]|nr:1-deoxy-D-xylulose-5-phosphate reductoisomerase [Xanthomonadales bacterium]MBP6691038.1 1-deoxy-D-xylulose-5-phosphate reductoisomerase [Xanthomonadales bacterium]MBP7418088.1 1-deoxy-D-xylulose-5-phosphate reductoisomerase [Xanthomonadales bacterium]MBP8176712.1 1-deoxy-D-xylulose-5-phosphate reductoisomerase [Xanthomonadales bacterium]HQX25207.1 1-deoxy-D-xylulose-5-phosphate reductoisomerase [Pseudomonadota bacterium]
MRVRKRVALLGATGSIGASTADVLLRHPQRFEAVALSAHRDVAGLVARCRALRPQRAVIADPTLLDALARGLREAALATEPLAGPAALAAIAAEAGVDCVVAAIVGAAGLESTLAAARAGKQLLLANKEAVVMAGPLLAAALATGGGTLLPLDSEHNAVFQCLPPGYARDPGRHGIERIILTASGGPFRGWRAEALDAVTPEQACAHPNWRMGRKISVDSATLMNKGLEVIEAHGLFGLAPDRIEVVVHPQSVIHSLVAYRDGSTLAQLGNPDMRTAIAGALAWPERIEAGVPALDLIATRRLEFEAVDADTFRCLGLAYAALRAGGAAPTVLNAANEVAVEAFLNGRLRFPGIAAVVERTLATVSAPAPDGIEAILDADRRAREAARDGIARA